MKRKWKIILWILPVLGIVLGYVFAFLSYHGYLETWQLIGTPDGKVERILGFGDALNFLVATEKGKLYGLGDARHLIVATASGSTYSLEFAEGDEVSLPSPPLWKKIELYSVEPWKRLRPVGLQYYADDFYTLPTPFSVQQLYELGYIFGDEGEGEVKFALAQDGNVWMWNHRISGFPGRWEFTFLPVFGFIAGLAVVMAVLGGTWLRRFKPGRNEDAYEKLWLDPS